VGKEILKDQRLLTRFILKLRFLPDTPALIQFVAGDEDYLLLCSRIVNDSNDHSTELQPLKDICRKNEYDFHILTEKLTPVARAFGLIADESDYYELLGVSRDADQNEIKKAFRKKVIEVHPDTGDQISDSGREFISLQTAYQILADPSLRQQYDENLDDVNRWKENQILADPSLRQQYDENLDDVNRWKEKANHTQGLPAFQRLNPLIFKDSNPIQSARAKIYYQLGGLFLILIIVAFIFDFLYRQNSIFDTDYTVKQKQAQEQKPLKAAAKAASDRKTEKNSSAVKSVPDRSDKSRSTVKPDDIFQKANVEVPDHVSKSNWP
jgi:curved DNA-binding protein CbpA